MGDYSFLIKKLALGTAQFGFDYGISNIKGQTSENEVHVLLNWAWQQGIETLDTASVYGNSEEVLGRQMNHPFQLITKFPANITSDKNLFDALHASLQKLCVKEIYGLLAHDAASLIRNPALWQTMIYLRELNIVKKIGYSLYAPAQLIELLKLKMVPDIVQFPFNILDQRFKPFFETLKSETVEIHARSVFLQGLFFMTPDQLPAFFDDVKPLLTKIRNQFSSKIKLAAALLYSSLQETSVDKIVFGVNDLQQLMENVASLTDVDPISTYIPKIADNILLPSLWPKINAK